MKPEEETRSGAYNGTRMRGRKLSIDDHVGSTTHYIGASSAGPESSTGSDMRVDANVRSVPDAYNGAQRAARETRDMPDRNQKKSARKDESLILQDDSSSSGDERDVIPEEQ